MHAAHAIAPNLAPPPEERRPVSESKAFAPVEVPPLPARRSAMPPCRLPITVAFFFIFPAAPQQGFLEGTTYGESTVY